MTLKFQATGTTTLISHVDFENSGLYCLIANGPLGFHFYINIACLEHWGHTRKKTPTCLWIDIFCGNRNQLKNLDSLKLTVNIILKKSLFCLTWKKKNSCFLYAGVYCISFWIILVVLDPFLSNEINLQPNMLVKSNYFQYFPIAAVHDFTHKIRGKKT